MRNSSGHTPCLSILSVLILLCMHLPCPGETLTVRIPAGEWQSELGESPRGGDKITTSLDFGSTLEQASP